MVSPRVLESMAWGRAEIDSDDCIVCHGHSIRTFDSRSNSIGVGCSCVRCLQLIDLYGGRDRTRTCGLLRVKQAL